METMGRGDLLVFREVGIDAANTIPACHTGQVVRIWHTEIILLAPSNQLLNVYSYFALDKSHLKS